MISVILPVYNAEKYLVQCIDSILTQTFKDIELIIVNDGSTDKSKEIIDGYKDFRIRKIHLDKNLGKYSAGPINIGLQHCTGDYITWVSADDYYLEPTALYTLYNALINTNSDFISAPYKQIGIDPHLVSFKEGIITKSDLLNQNCIGACFLFKKEVYDVVGPMNENLVGVDDWDYWLHIVMCDFNMFKIGGNSLIAWRKHGENTTTKLEKNCIENLNKLRKKYENYNTNINL